MNHIRLVCIGMLLISIALVGCSRTGYRTTRTAEGKVGMVVSAHPLASEVGKDILTAGGNATDAAIAVQFALAVVCPRAGNLGGGGFWLHAPAGDRARALDYREKAPAAAARDMYLDKDGEVVPKASTFGPLAAGIPGTVDGMWTAYTFASTLKDWGSLVRPAANLARKGFKITQTEADRLNRYREDFTQFAKDSPFYKAGEWQEGDLLIQPVLAATLDSIAVNGPAYFYDSGFAERLVEELRELGGIWSAQDLSDYQSRWRDPISFDYRGYQVHSMPPPSSGGVVLAQMMQLLEAYDLKALREQDEVAYYHLLIESMRRAYEDRASYLGDPDQVQIPIDSLLDADYLAAKWQSFTPDSASRSKASMQAIGPDVYETTHTSVVDGTGNAVAVTTTLNGNYGSKVWSEVGGFFLNNEMDDFSAKPGVPNMFGLVGGEANAIAPGKRMLSSMTPTIVQQKGETVLALGSPGGSTIITAVMQVMLNYLDHGLSLKQAIDEPRIHHQWLPDVAVYERGKFDEELLGALEAKGHSLRDATSIGRVKAVANEAQVRIGAGDARNPDDDASGY